MAPTNIAICVPARNEAGSLPMLLDAIGRLDRDPSWRVRTCLLLDGCADDSIAVLEAYQARHSVELSIEQSPVGVPNAGRARHTAMRLGLQALAGGDGLLLSTDADSVPTRTWLTTMTRALERADVVAGRILRTVTRASPVQDRLERYYDALFALRRRLDPVPWESSRTHHCAGGANLGVRADVYLAMGGFAPLARGEDARLVDDASRAGWRVRRDADCVVHTSDRRIGRAEGGLALALQQIDCLDEGAVDIIHPADAAWQYEMHAAARAAFSAGRPEAIAAGLGISAGHARGVARDCPNDEAFAMRIVPTPPGGMRRVTLAEAEVALKSLGWDSLAA